MIKISLNGEEITQNPLIPDVLACRSFYGAKVSPSFSPSALAFPASLTFQFPVSFLSRLVLKANKSKLVVLRKCPEFSQASFLRLPWYRLFSRAYQVVERTGRWQTYRGRICHSKCFKLFVRLVLASRINLALQQGFFFPITLIISFKVHNVWLHNCSYYNFLI